jgi:hypothetical protein
MLTATQIACKTDLTRTGKMNMKNRKPFRTAAQKKLAKDTAYKADNGSWRSTAPVSYNHYI